MKWLLPPILWLICAGIIVALSITAPQPSLLPNPVNYAGFIFLLAGAALFKTAARQIMTAKTNIHTFKSPTALLTTGVFAVSRNPIYLGFLIALLGVAIMANTPYGFLAVLAFWAAAQFWYIPFEERAALKQFGEAYDDYRASVRRWL